MFKLDTVERIAKEKKKTIKRFIAELVTFLITHGYDFIRVFIRLIAIFVEYKIYFFMTFYRKEQWTKM